MTSFHREFQTTGAQSDYPDKELLSQIDGKLQTRTRRGGPEVKQPMSTGAVSKTQGSSHSPGGKTWILTTRMSPTLYTKTSEKREILAELGWNAWATFSRVTERTW